MATMGKFDFSSESDWKTEPGGSASEVIFDRFRLVAAPGRKDSKLGVGGMGVVHLAEDLLLKHYVAIKVPPTDLGIDSEAKREMLEETKRGLKLTHSNIVRVYDFHVAENNWGISMQYVEGRNLSDLRAENVMFDPKKIVVEDVRPWLFGICEALSYAHEVRSMVHRDLTPRNIMLEKIQAPRAGEFPYRPYLMDFGIADNIYHSLARTIRNGGASGQSGPGARPYISPGQLRGEMAKASDDIYSLGALLYDLFTSKPPFFRRDGIEYQIETQVPPPIAVRRRELDVENPFEVPPDWEEVIHACLEKDPSNRPQSIHEISDLLGLNPDRRFEATSLQLQRELDAIRVDNGRTNSQRAVAKYSVILLTTMALAALLGVGAAFLFPSFRVGGSGAGVAKVESAAVPGEHYANGLAGMAFVPDRDKPDLLVGRGLVPAVAFREFQSQLSGNQELGQVEDVPGPVVGVSWFDASRFCVWLTEVERSVGNIPERASYTLPNAAEIESNASTIEVSGGGEWLSDEDAEGRRLVTAAGEGSSFAKVFKNPAEIDNAVGFRCVLRLR